MGSTQKHIHNSLLKHLGQKIDEVVKTCLSSLPPKREIYMKLHVVMMSSVGSTSFKRICLVALLRIVGSILCKELIR